MKEIYPKRRFMPGRVAKCVHCALIDTSSSVDGRHEKVIESSHVEIVAVGQEFPTLT